MPQIGSDNNPVYFRKTFAGKGSTFRKNMDMAKYKENFDKIFKKSPEPDSEIETARSKSKTFSMEQD